MHPSSLPPMDMSRPLEGHAPGPGLDYWRWEKGRCTCRHGPLEQSQENHSHSHRLLRASVRSSGALPRFMRHMWLSDLSKKHLHAAEVNRRPPSRQGSYTAFYLLLEVVLYFSCPPFITISIGPNQELSKVEQVCGHISLYDASWPMYLCWGQGNFHVRIRRIAAAEIESLDA